MTDLSELVLLFCLFCLAGFVKGLVGIGIPPILLAALTFVYDPRYTVSLIMIPIVASNARQAVRGGDVAAILRKHLWFLPISSLTIAASAFFASDIPTSTLLILIGFAMALFALTSLVDRIPPISSRWIRPVQVLSALASGLLGGISGIWGPPMLVYLCSLKLPATEFIQTIGVFFFILSLSMGIGLIFSGDLTIEVAVQSLFLTIPVFLGMRPGERLRESLGDARFQRWFLFAFLILGLNLIRKGVVS